MNPQMSDLGCLKVGACIVSSMGEVEAIAGEVRVI